MPEGAQVMAPPVPASSPSEESAVPMKKARRGKGSISSRVSQAAKDGRKRRSSSGRDDTPQDSAPHSQQSTSRPFTPLQNQNQNASPATLSAMSMPQGKMLLPRLQQPKSLTPDIKATGKERTSHACDKCRKAKAKCTGGHPCENCKLLNRECIYGDGKRDKVKKDLERLSKQNRELVEQARSMRDFMAKLRRDPTGSEKAGRDIDEFLSTLKPLGPADGDERRGSGDTGEDDADAQDVASMGSLDAINEDTNRDEDTRAAGYLGKSSAVRWVQRTKYFLDMDDENKGSQKDAKDPDNAFMTATCHADERDYPGIDIDKDSVNPCDMPPLLLARILVDQYFKHVHPSLPILSQQDFKDSFDKYIVDSRSDQPEIDEKQQNFFCCLNMVFAIAARHAHVTNAKHRGVETDHLIFFARARALGLDDKALHQDAELENTTSLGLVALYFLTLELFNRAWTWSGLALRSALTLGLHLRSQTRSLCDVDKEYRVRIFWSLYCLERVMNQLTGRPSCIAPRDMCANIPLNVDESSLKRDVTLYDDDRNTKSEFYGASAAAAARAVPPLPKTHPAYSSRSERESPMDTSPGTISSSTVTTSVSASRRDSQATPTLKQIASQEISTSTYFIHRLRLSIISHEIFNDLYSPTMVLSKWSDIQNVMRSIDNNIQIWRESMPWQLRFNPENPRSNRPPAWKIGEPVRDLQEREKQWKDFAGMRIALAMMWCSSRMMLYRPTLCRISPDIRNESDRSKAFNSESAAKCIESARNMIACLPRIQTDQESKRSGFFESEDGRFGQDVIGIHSFVPWWNTVHYIIEGSSVLIMELAYRADHMPSQVEGMYEDTRAAISWMRRLAPQSVMAKKASVIYEVLLRRVAPRVGRNAGSLTKEGKLPRGWDGSSSSSDHDLSSDTVRWSGHNESAARYEHHPGLGSRQPYAGQQHPHQRQHTYGQPPTDQQGYPQHYLTTAPSPNTLFGPPLSELDRAELDALTLIDLGGLDALQNFHFAGPAYGVYDQFGPWHNNGLDNFGFYDPVMQARMGMDVDHTFSGQSQNHSSMGDDSQMGSGSGRIGHTPVMSTIVPNQQPMAGGSGHISQVPIMNPNMGNQQQMGQNKHSPLRPSQVMTNGQLGNGHNGSQQVAGQMDRSPHTQMAAQQMPISQMGMNGGMSTGISIPPVTASDMGRPVNYDSPQRNHQKLPPIQQIDAGSMQQGGAYQPFVWTSSLPPVSQARQQPQNQAQFPYPPPAHGPGINLPYNQGMDGHQGQGQHSQHPQHGRAANVNGQGHR